MKNIWIGTAGYRYDDWNGPFYSDDLKGWDFLKYYSRFFNTVEINSTFYTFISSSYFDKAVKNSPDNFIFNVKLHQNFTHKFTDQKDSMEKFKYSINPLIQAERLGRVLVQFPYSFKAIPENLEYILSFKEHALPLVFEFRNYFWSKPGVINELKRNDIRIVSVDAPRLKGLFPSGIMHTSRSTLYLRLHGRNSKDWWRPKQAYMRYDYRYADKELEEIVIQIEKVKENIKELYIIFNNHFQAKAVQNALKMKELFNI